MSNAVIDTVAIDRPSGEDLVTRVHAMGDLIAANATQAEADRRIPDSSIQAMADAGLFKLAVPARYGGYGTPMTSIMKITAAIGEYDGATSWVHALLTACAWTVAQYPKRAQDDVWGENPDARVSGVFADKSENVKKVDGGYTMSGKWPFNSGSFWSDWFMVSFTNPDGGGPLFGLLPRADMEIEDTWFTTGMRGTASNTIVLDNTFIPDHRVLPVMDAVMGLVPNELEDDQPLFRAPFNPFLVLIIAAPQLGLGRAALKLVQAAAPKRALTGTAYRRQADSPAFQMRVARAALKISTSELHAKAGAEDIDRLAAQGPATQLDLQRIVAYAAFIAEETRDAINMLMTAHGPAAFAESSLLQRYWRDSNTGGRHMLLLEDARYEMYGQALLDAEIKMPGTEAGVVTLDPRT